MMKPIMIENEQDLHCANHHNFPISFIACDIRLEKNQRLLCYECIDNLELNTNLVSFKKVQQIIEEYQNRKKQSVENIIMINVKQIQQLLQPIQQIKQNIIQLLDSLVGYVNEWINNFIILGQENLNYSFYEELDKIITQKKFGNFNQESLIHQATIINQSWYQKILNKFNQFKSYQKCQNFQDILKILNQINEKITQQNLMEHSQVNNNDQEEKSLENQESQQKQQQIIDNQVELKLIDDTKKQIGYSLAIAFDKSGSIMISCEYKVIKIWTFEKGRLNFSNSYQIHTQDVLCLVYSKQRNSFISGSRDNTIILWQQIKQAEWKSSQPFQQHTDNVNCLMLNKQEDQLISGGLDNSIKVWKVDFINNELTFLYHLDQHTNSVESFSLNQSETILASCGFTHFIIWEKGLQGKWEFKYKKDVSDGCKIYFINDRQFIFVTSSFDTDDILVFEEENGVFQQNSNKTIKLEQNNECQDDDYFPIIHNQERNIILLRHKFHIYLIRQQENKTLKVSQSLNCQTKEIYGSMTDDGQYLVFWDYKNRKYSSYKILNK